MTNDELELLLKQLIYQRMSLEWLERREAEIKRQIYEVQQEIAKLEAQGAGCRRRRSPHARKPARPLQDGGSH